MFKIAVLVHAIISGAHDRYSIGEFPSLQQCEAERIGIVDVFERMLKRRYSQPLVIESRCMKDGEST